MESTPMLTLEEAVAKYKALWNRYTYTGDTPPENSPLINVIRREEVDAAVKNVALAAGEWFNDPDRDAVSLQPYFRDYIRRLLGDSPHG